MCEVKSLVTQKQRFKENIRIEVGDEEVSNDGFALRVKVEKNKKEDHVTFHKCSKCGLSFNDRVSNVRRHILSHYEQVFLVVLPDRIPFNCPICDMSFKWRGSLVRHFAFSHQKIFELTYLTPEDLLYSKSHMKKLEKKHCESDEKITKALLSPLLNESEEASAEEQREVQDIYQNTVPGITLAPVSPSRGEYH